MFSKFCFLLYALCWVSENSLAYYNNNFGNHSLEYLKNFRKLSEDSVIGMFTREIHNSYFSRRIRNPPATSDCKPSTGFTLGYVTYYSTRNPFGNCPLCCQINNAHQHIQLYWTCKSKGSKVTKLAINNKAGDLSIIKFNPNLTTVIYIHGFTQDGLGYHARKVYDAYLSRDEEYNVILVDWKDLSAFPWYIQAKLNTELVASYLHNFIKFYSSTGELLISKLHMVGFSLGSHIAGMIGKKIKNIPRITGLDTAFPLYVLNDTSNRLVKTDANYVDIVHTDVGRLGFPISIGHADFYPNYGKLVQPGCSIGDLQLLRSIELFGVCDHYIAAEFYAESVRNPKAFPSTKCNFSSPNVAKECRLKADSFMGFPASRRTAMGNYYLRTRNHPPYGKSNSEKLEKFLKL